MKNQIIKISLIVFGAAMLFSCDSKKDSAKIEELEKKIAALETNGAASTTVSPTTTPEPEVKPEGPIPSFEFAETNFDFGNINEGDEVEHVFQFTNTGDAPLLIESARGSCGCTVPSWPKEPIAVGATGEILVKFNSKGKPGVQNKTVTITANTFPSISKLQIKSTVAKAADLADGPVAQ